MSPTATAADDETKRPLALLFVYSWDMLRALLALLAALAAFGGGISIGGRDVAIPLFAQVIGAVSYAAYAASLIVVAMVLTRHQRWVRSVQIGSLFIAIVLAMASLLAQRITDAPALLGNALVIVLDVVAIYAMTGDRVRQWYVVPGRTPRYVTVCLAVWTVVSVAFVVYAGLAV